jgi:cell division septum initiation protein DivIVA
VKISRQQIVAYVSVLKSGSTSIEKQAEAASQAKTAEWIERGVQNLQVAIDRAQAGTHDTEISATDMSDQPLKYEVLKNAAPDSRPTLGFRAKFWALNFSDGSGPAPLPGKVRTSLTKAFDKVATWAAELRTAKARAASIVADAEKAAGDVLSNAEAGAARIIEEARKRGDERASVDVGIRSYSSYLDLVKRKIRHVLGEDGYDRVAKEVNAEWPSHPDNPDRPLTQAVRARSSISGPSGP